MIYKISTLLLFCLLSFTCVYAERNEEWLNTEYDFGLIKETDGVQSCEFRFVNKGKKAVKITDVKVSCGCTEATFTKGKIAKGDTAVIKVAYDPEERPGKFDKGIYVYIDHELPKRLNIKGTVIASPSTLQFLYPHNEGDLFFDTLDVNFGEVKKGNRSREYVDIYNAGTTAVDPYFEADSDALQIKLDPEKINPGEAAALTVILDSSRLNWTGEKQMAIKGKWQDNGEEREVEIKVKATIIP